MATVRDVIPPFQLFQPTSLDEAVDLVTELGDAAWIMAGGMDSFDWLKDRTKRTGAVIELSMVEELRGIREADGGLEIGAMTTLTDVAESTLVRERFSMLADAAALVASPQIRHQGTLGGNISQDTRCWYYRSGWTCYRAGGNTCYADTPSAINREHAILGANRCVAVSPSDTAPALGSCPGSLPGPWHHVGSAVKIARSAAGDGITARRTGEYVSAFVRFRSRPRWRGFMHGLTRSKPSSWRNR